MESEEHHKQVLAISKVADQIADEFFGDEPDWDPLHVVLPLEWCNGFMWMCRVSQGDAAIELYKHGITRRYLNLDQFNRAYQFNGKGYDPIPVAIAVDRVFADLEELGWSRGTRYDDEFVAEKHRRLRENGWTVISTGAPDLEPGSEPRQARDPAQGVTRRQDGE